MIPQDLRYTKDHEWLKIEGQTATVGITDHAQNAMGDITFVELPPIDRKVAAHDSLGVIESVKAASDVYAPLAGRVSAINEALSTAPEMINQDPYGNGWLCRLDGIQEAGLADLMDAAAYQAYLEGK